jgi:hypothetical protein
MPYSFETILPPPKDRMTGDICIRCPTTGQPVPTGLDTETVVFDALPKIDLRMQCPACGKAHIWDRTKAWVVERRKTNLKAKQL